MLVMDAGCISGRKCFYDVDIIVKRSADTIITSVYASSGSGDLIYYSHGEEVVYIPYCERFERA